ncbi:hypothetical protein PROFUN_17040, partial [Planoprotostelium fungivorum]
LRSVSRRIFLDFVSSVHRSCSVFHCPFEEDPSNISLGFESVSSTVHSPDTTFRANLQGNDTTSALVHHYILAMSIPHYNTLVTNVSNLVTGAQGDPTAEQAITFLQYGETHDEWCGQQNLLPTLLLRAKVIQGPPAQNAPTDLRSVSRRIFLDFVSSVHRSCSVFHCPFEEDPSNISLGFESASSTVHSPWATSSHPQDLVRIFSSPIIATSNSLKMPYTATHPNRGHLNSLIQQHRTNGYNTTFRGEAAVRILSDPTVDDAKIDVWYADAQAANTDADWEGLRDAIVPPPAGPLWGSTGLSDSSSHSGS